jgi:hypothetical protein
MKVWKSNSFAVNSFILSVVVVFVNASLQDGRSMRREVMNKYLIRHNLFHAIDDDERFSEGWLKRELRCSKQKVERVKSRWEEANKALDSFRPVFGIRERVALTLYHRALLFFLLF